MQRRAAPAALTALALILACPGLLLAKPTRTPSRPASRLVAPSSAHSAGVRAAHARPGPQRAAHPSAHAATHAAPRREAPKAAPAATSARRLPARERRQREAASRAAILAADRAASRPRLPHDGTATGDEPAETASLSSSADSLPSAAPSPLRMKSLEEEVTAPVLPPIHIASLYDSRGRLIVPPPLYGSHEILLHQNQMADRDGLLRVRDDSDLLDLLREKKLVALPIGESLRVDERLPDNRRYSRPWTAEFLAVLSRDYYTTFHQPLFVTSAVRTVAVQERLVRTNGNAAPPTGDTASPHLTGQAVDIAKHGLSMTEIAWLRTYLAPLIDLGKIDVEEEFQQSCFHISVYKEFLPNLPHVTVAAGPQLTPERPTE